MTIIQTERLRLRALTVDDAPFYLRLLSDRSFIDNIGDKGVHTLAAARVALADGPCKMQAERGYSLYLVERSSDGAPIGMCGVIKRDTLPDPDIGYALLPAYWGQGYAYEAGAAVVAHARGALALPRLLGITSPQNTASNQLLRKLGLEFWQCAPLTPDGPQTNLYRIELNG